MILTEQDLGAMHKGVLTISEVVEYEKVHKHILIFESSILLAHFYSDSNCFGAGILDQYGFECQEVSLPILATVSYNQPPFMITAANDYIRYGTGLRFPLNQRITSVSSLVYQINCFMDAVEEAEELGCRFDQDYRILENATE